MMKFLFLFFFTDYIALDADMFEKRAKHLKTKEKRSRMKVIFVAVKCNRFYEFFSFSFVL